MQAIKGNIVYAKDVNTLQVHADSWVVYDNNGTIMGIYPDLIAAELDLSLESKTLADKCSDYGDCLIIPGFIDLHTHAPQYLQRGLGLDKQLIDWLNDYTFTGESKFSDVEHARLIYTKFVKQLLKSGTTRVSILATIHRDATDLLFQICKQLGLPALIGKVNMDQNSPDYLRESWQQSLADTEYLIEKYQADPVVQPIITPRFVPSCTENLLKGLGRLANDYKIPVQSHLSENKQEIAWVHQLYPKHRDYADVYDSYGLFGQTPTLMAHCIYLEEREIELMQSRNVYAVHCPESNMNIASGLMPFHSLKNRGIKLALGSDVGAAQDLMMSKTMVAAMQNSKLLQASSAVQSALTATNVFYTGTVENGQFLNSTHSYQQRNLRVGKLEKGYCLDALVIDDSELGIVELDRLQLSIAERLERFMYIGDDRQIKQKYIAGKMVG